MAVTEWGKTCAELTTEMGSVNHAVAAGFTGVRKGNVRLWWLTPKFPNTTKVKICVSQMVSLTEGSERTLCDSGRMFWERSQAVRITITLVHLPEEAASVDQSRLMREAVCVAPLFSDLIISFWHFLLYWFFA